MQPPIPFPSFEATPPVTQREEHEEPPSIGRLLGVGDLDLNTIPPSEPIKFMDANEDSLLNEEGKKQGVPKAGQEEDGGYHHHHHLADEL